MFQGGLAATLLVGTLFVATPAFAQPVEEVRAGFDRFVAAQNHHDIAEVQRLLAGTDAFVWITRGTVVKGRSAAIDRFRDLYRGTWQLTVTSLPEAFVIDHDNVQLVAPVTFTVGPAGRAPTDTRFLLTQLWHRHGREWQIISLLPIPNPAS